LTENGSKWSKKSKKRRSEVRESESLNEKIKEDRSTRKDGSWTTQKMEKSTNGYLENLTGKKERQAGEALKTRVKWT
jgi:hypothetical protein